MISLPVQLSPGMIAQAKAYAFLRKRCKEYLASKNIEFDKFSIVEHDSFTGFITENFIYHYLKKHFEKEDVSIHKWEEQFEIKRINRILSRQSNKKEDIQYIREYFYDAYDIHLSQVDRSYKIDVKTAFTALKPNLKWNFLYPVIQAGKEGKDLIFLTYYIVEDLKDPESLKEIVWVGFINKEQILSRPVIKAGEKTKFGTTSQVDNYITELSKDYCVDLDKLFN